MTLPKKVPLALQQAIKDGKKILVLINPPYAEATSGDTITGGANKTGVAKTKFAATAMTEYGKATNELFTQFLARIATEIPNAIIGIFSPLKYVNAPTLEKFRETWQAKYKNGLVVHSKVFEGLTGNFPIGFLIWETNQLSTKKITISEIITEVLDKNIQPIGEKLFFNAPSTSLLTEWIIRPNSNRETVVPLKNAFTPATSGKDLRGTKWANGAIGWFNCAGNDLQNAGQKTMLFSSGYGSGRGLFVVPDNLWQVAIVYSVRHLVKHTWLNHNDQFLKPTEPLTDEFKHDCLIWMLFHGKNLAAGAKDLEWNGQKWSIVNHFIPFTEEQVGAPDRFESNFMVDYLKGKKLSAEAKAVLKQGQILWQQYFSERDNHKTRQELKLNRPDVGWYQVRKALEARALDGAAVDFSAFKTTYEALSDKLRPLVFKLGFMR